MVLMEPRSCSTSEKSRVWSSKAGCAEISTSVFVSRNFLSLLVLKDMLVRWERHPPQCLFSVLGHEEHMKRVLLLRWLT